MMVDLGPRRAPCKSRENHQLTREKPFGAHQLIWLGTSRHLECPAPPHEGCWHQDHSQLCRCILCSASWLHSSLGQETSHRLNRAFVRLLARMWTMKNRPYPVEGNAKTRSLSFSS